MTNKKRNKKAKKHCIRKAKKRTVKRGRRKRPRRNIKQKQSQSQIIKIINNFDSKRRTYKKRPRKPSRVLTANPYKNSSNLSLSNKLPQNSILQGVRSREELAQIRLGFSNLLGQKNEAIIGKDNSEINKKLKEIFGEIGDIKNLNKEILQDSQDRDIFINRIVKGMIKQRQEDKKNSTSGSDSKNNNSLSVNWKVEDLDTYGINTLKSYSKLYLERVLKPYFKLKKWRIAGLRKADMVVKILNSKGASFDREAVDTLLTNISSDLADLQGQRDRRQQNQGVREVKRPNDNITDVSPIKGQSPIPKEANSIQNESNRQTVGNLFSNIGRRMIATVLEETPKKEPIMNVDEFNKAIDEISTGVGSEDDSQPGIDNIGGPNITQNFNTSYPSISVDAMREFTDEKAKPLIEDFGGNPQAWGSPNINMEEVFGNDYYQDLEQTEDEKDNKGNKKGATYGAGAGSRTVQPLYDYQIDAMLEQYRPYGYLGNIMIDEVSDLKKASNLDFDQIGWVQNLDRSNGPGTHWIGVFIDLKNDKAIEWYDPLVSNPPEKWLEDVASFLDYLGVEYYPKLKINRVKHQRADTNTCGLFAIKFLQDRFNGKSWKEATDYENTREGEEEVRKLYKFVPDKQGKSGGKFNYFIF